MKFYVAGKYEDKERVRRAQRCVTDAGHEVTHDWTTAPEQGGPKEAEEDRQGVVAADALLFVNIDPDLRYAGSLVEIGIAVALEKQVYFLNRAHMERNVFYHLPCVQSAESAPPALAEALAREFGASLNGASSQERP